MKLSTTYVCDDMLTALLQGVMYLGSPLGFMAMRRWPIVLRWGMRAGLVILVVSMIASSFATKVWQLVLTQGALYAIGASLMYYPIIIYVDEWFVRRKGLAFGVMWVSSKDTPPPPHH